MKPMKRLGAFLVSAAMAFTMLPGLQPATAKAAEAATLVLTINSPTMTVKGTAKPIDNEGSKPVLDKGGYTMLPLRGVVEAMGGSLTWNAAERSVTMVKDAQTVKLTVGSTKASVNGAEREMTANGGVYKAPYINAGGRTLVHVRSLELFTGTKCNWNAATQQVTVGYPDNTAPIITSKNYRVDVMNKTGYDITNLRYGVAGTFQYSQTNALTKTLAKDGTASFYISVPDNATVRVYDFYTEGAAGTKLYSGLNLNGVNAYATVMLKNTTAPSFEQANDKTITVQTVGVTTLKFTNNSSRAIEELYMSKTNSFTNAENLLATETVKSKKSTSLSKIDLDGAKTWYFRAVTDNGKKYEGKVTFSSATVKNATLTLTSGNKLTLDGDEEGETLLTFENKSSDTIEGIYMVTKKSDLDDLDDLENLLDYELDKGETEEISVLLEGNKSWYVTVVFSSESDIEKKQVLFENKDPKSATLRIKSNGVEIRDEKKASGSSSSSSVLGGDLMVALVNGTTQKVRGAYLVESGQGKNFDIEDYDPEEDDLLAGDELKSGEAVVLEDLADPGKYDLVLYYGSGDSNFSYTSVNLSDAEEYAAIHINSYSSSQFKTSTYTDDEDKILLGLANDTGYDITSISITSDEDSSKSLYSSRLSDGEVVYVELDRSKFDAIDLVFRAKVDGRTYEYSWDDSDEYSAFTYITFESDEDEECTIENIDEF